MTSADAHVDVDVVLAGPLFLDLVFTGLDGRPAAGTEVRAREYGVSPGGIANLAVAATRLGLRSSLASVFGDDVHGRWSWEVLGEHEGIDLSRSRMIPGFTTAVTVAIEQDADRSMVTYDQQQWPVSVDELLSGPLRARTALSDLNALRDEGEPDSWWKRASRAGTRIFADIGWDSSERWDPRDLDPLAYCHAFTPNSREALAYTRADEPREAARRLAEQVPLVVVTCGAAGAVAIDAATGEEAAVPSIRTDFVDATGAGDVFGAALVAGTLAEWPLAQRLAFAALCAGLSVGQLGGSFGAPGWAEIGQWWDRARAGGDEDLLRRYGFLSDVLPADAPAAVRRARPGLYFARTS